MEQVRGGAREGGASEGRSLEGKAVQGALVWKFCFYVMQLAD